MNYDHTVGLFIVVYLSVHGGLSWIGWINFYPPTRWVEAQLIESRTWVSHPVPVVPQGCYVTYPSIVENVLWPLKYYIYIYWNVGWVTYLILKKKINVMYLAWGSACWECLLRWSLTTSHANWLALSQGSFKPSDLGRKNSLAGANT